MAQSQIRQQSIPSVSTADGPLSGFCFHFGTGRSISPGSSENKVGYIAGRLRKERNLRMESTSFYSQILGISSPWKIVKVELDLEAEKVMIRAKVDRKVKWGNPETKPAASLHKWTERTWRHLDTCQFETLITANVPSVKQPGR